MTCQPFVGRGAQLAALDAHADAVVAGGGRFVLVVGEEGAGRSRLLAEHARGQARRDVRVAWSRCWPGGGGPPLWPWPDLVAELDGRPPPVVASARGEDERFARFRDLVERLRGACRSRPAVVLLDDLDEANQDVVLLTRFVARSLHRFPLLLVATWRRPTGAEAATAAFDGLVRDAHVVELPPLDVDDVAEYLRRAGQVAPHDAVAALHEASGGNPMLLAELVGSPQEPGARLDLSGAVARRVASFDVRQRRVLGTAALLGPGATVAETAAVLGIAAADVSGVVASTSGATVVGDEIRFGHQLVRAACAAAVPATERERLHLAARDAITGHGPDAAVRRAQHAVAAAPGSPGAAAIAVAACADATHELLAGLALEQARSWAATGDSLAGKLDDPAVRAGAVLLHADATLACGHLGEARELYDRAVRPAELAGDGRLLARAALGLGGVWVEEQRGDVARRRMLTLCRRALDALPPDEVVLAARLRVRLAAERAYDGEAVDVGAAVEAVRRLGDPAALAGALSLLHHTMLVPESAEDRLGVADEMLDAAVAAGPSGYALFGLCWRTVDLYLLGDPAAERSFVDLRERAGALGCRSVGYIVAVLDVMRTIRRGDLVAAEAAAADALALGEAAGDADALAYYGGHLLAIRWMQGRVGEMLETIRSVIDSSTLRRRDAIYPALLALATAIRGDAAAARTIVDGLLADGLDALAGFSTSTGTFAVLVELAAELDDAELAAALAEQVRPVAHLPVMPSLAVACLGPGERLMGRALATCGRWDEAVDWLRRAMATNCRLQNRPVAAILRAELAGALTRRGEPGDAAEAARLRAAAIELGETLGLDERVAAWVEGAASAGIAPPPPVAAPSHGTIERCTDGWRIALDGRTAHVDALVGMAYVVELVVRPDADLSALDLCEVVVGPGVVSASTGAPALDRRARDAYRRRLLELDADLDAADRAGDARRGRRAAEERRALLAQLQRDVGLGGRARRQSDDAERCRMRVSKAIRRVLARLDEIDPVIGRTLARAIRTGYVCRYETDPGRPIAWTVRRRIAA